MRSTVLLLVTASLACGGRAVESSSSPAPTPAASSPVPYPIASPSAPPDVGACPASIQPPAGCGEWADACAGVGVLAVGTFALLSGLAVNGDGAYFIATPTDLSPGCGNVIYRTTSAGATAIVSTTASITSVAADDRTVYWAERVNGGFAVHDGSTVVGTLPDDAGPLVQSHGQVVVAAASEVWRVTRAGLVSLAKVPATSFIASFPEVDGDTVFVSLETIDPYASTLARVDGTTITTLATGAATRLRRTIAVDGDDVFFVTGDDSSVHGVLGRPMGVRRVSRDGGAATTIVPESSTEIVSSIHLVGDAIDFIVGDDVRTVYRDGGPVTTILAFHEAPHDPILHDGTLFFRLDVGGRKGELSAPGGVIGANAVIPR